MIQSILFNKKHYNIDQAVNWLIANGYKPLKVDITDKLYRFRLHNPKKNKLHFTKIIKKRGMIPSIYLVLEVEKFSKIRR